MSSQPENRVVRRPDGSIDIEHYVRRAERLRARAIAGFFHDVSAAVRRAWRRLRRARARRAERRALMRMGERALRDIGLTPFDIDAVMNCTYFEDVTRRDRSRRTRLGIRGACLSC